MSDDESETEISLATTDEAANIATAQRADPSLLPLILRLTNGELPTDSNKAEQVKQDSNYQLKNSILVRSVNNDNISSSQGTSHRIVIPASMKHALMLEYHDSSCAAHLGLDKTYSRLSSKYYWKNMYAEVKRYINSCVKCAQKKTAHHHREIPISSLPTPSHPFECLGMDILGPLPRTIKGNQYILVITDYLTKWPIALAMKNQRASTIATLLVEQVFCQYGYPATILSDRGKNFLSHLMSSVLQLLKIRHLKTSSYHPQTNGLT